MTNLPSRCFQNLSKVVEISLDHNTLTTLSKNLFVALHAIARLSLQYNKLNKLDFILPPSLQFLDLSYNSITFIQSSVFERLTSLQNLLLNNNLLHILPVGCFRSLNNLTHLLLSNNKLMITYGTFSGLTSLTTLELTNNSITDLPELIFIDLPNLQSLDISNNRIKALDVEILTTHLKSLRFLYLQGNRFPCVKLFDITQQLRRRGVDFGVQEEFFKTNVQGISCVHDNRENDSCPSAEEIKLLLEEWIKASKRLINQLEGSIVTNAANSITERLHNSSLISLEEDAFAQVQHSANPSPPISTLQKVGNEKINMTVFNIF